MTKLNHDCDSEREDQFYSKDSSVHLASSRTLFLCEDFSVNMSHKFCAMLLYLDQVSNTEPISIYINSDGGDTAALFQIYDTINLIKAPIQTICIGAAYSAGSVLLASGTPGLRYMYKSAQVMLHGIQFIFPLPHDTVDESKNKLNYYKRHNDDILKIVA